ncbi:hypothetical protein AB2H14_26630 (plasmid) [Escherichia coli]
MDTPALPSGFSAIASVLAGLRQGMQFRRVEEMPDCRFVATMIAQCEVKCGSMTNTTFMAVSPN